MDGRIAPENVGLWLHRHPKHPTPLKGPRKERPQRQTEGRPVDAAWSTDRAEGVCASLVGDERQQRAHSTARETGPIASGGCGTKF